MTRMLRHVAARVVGRARVSGRYWYWYHYE